MIPAFNGYLCFFSLAWKWGLDNLLNRPGRMALGFSLIIPPKAE